MKPEPLASKQQSEVHMTKDNFRAWRELANLVNQNQALDGNTLYLAADVVPALIDEVERLREELRLERAGHAQDIRNEQTREG